MTCNPLSRWLCGRVGPFEPQVVDGPHGKRVVARGAVDDKGQVAMWLAAFRAWHETAGTMPVPITAVIEGEEEIGSVNLETFLAENAGALAADAAVISDTDMWDVATAGDLHQPARPGLYAGRSASRRSRSAFRHVRRLRR